MKLDLVARGNPVMDILYTDADTLVHGGGSSATVTSTLGKLGMKSGIIGRVGNDDYGKQLRDELTEYGVDLSRLRSGGTTVISHIGVSANDRKIIRCEGDGTPLDEDDLSYIADSRAFYSRASSGHFHYLTSFCERTGTQVFASLQEFAISEGYENGTLCSPSVKVIFGNENETEGKRGCTIYCNSQAQHFDAHPVRAVDPTGAGDTFAGAFIYGYLNEWPLERTARFANRLGALTTTKYGALFEAFAAPAQGLV